MQEGCRVAVDVAFGVGRRRGRSKPHRASDAALFNTPRASALRAARGIPPERHLIGGTLPRVWVTFPEFAGLNVMMLDLDQWIRTNAGIIIAFAASCALAGCARPGPVGPVTPAPVVTAEDSFASEIPAGSGLTARPADDEMLAHWWSTLEDPLLASLVERAISDNLDLRLAEARVREARALRNQQGTRLRPTVTGGAGASADQSTSGGTNRVNDLYDAGFDASWEPDIFGGVRASIAAAEANTQAVQEELRDTLVSLTAEVALNYVDLRSFQARLDIARRNLEAQEESLKITSSRAQSGLTSQLDEAQARTNAEATRSTIPTLEQGVTQAQNRLAVLLGLRPGALSDELGSVGAIPVPPLEVAIGVPADLFRRRPDIRSSEQRVAQQAANVGVAMADLRPSFSLSGSVGVNGVSVADLFSVSGIVSSIAATFSTTVFNRSQLRAAVRVEDAVLDQRVTEYESTVLTALEDAENAIQAYVKEQVRRQALRRAADAARRSSELARSRYTAGLTDFLAVLDSQRSQLSAEDDLAQSEAAVTSNLISLYKAMGGGWDLATADAQPAANQAPPSSSP